MVEDNKELNNANRRLLELKKYTVHAELTLAAARERLNVIQPDIILLDVMLPDGDGFSFCKEIRGKTTAHIIFLTSKTGGEEKVRGLSGGGDDYIAKPFHTEELMARVEAAMRRRKMDKVPETIFSVGNLRIDSISGRAYANSNDLRLSPKEFALLLLFVKNEEHCMSAEYLYDKVWKSPMSGDNNAVKGAIKRLRSKIIGSGYCVAWSRGEGYSFERE